MQIPLVDYKFQNIEQWLTIERKDYKKLKKAHEVKDTTNLIAIANKHLKDDTKVCIGFYAIDTLPEALKDKLNERV